MELWLSGHAHRSQCAIDGMEKLYSILTVWRLQLMGSAWTRRLFVIYHIYKTRQIDNITTPYKQCFPIRSNIGSVPLYLPSRIFTNIQI